MKLRRGSILTMIAVPAVVIGLAACGGSSNSSSGTTAASNAAQTTAGGSGAISTKSIGGVGTVLVDSKGNALYTNNQDSGSKIVCTGSCNSIWPAVMATGGKPTSSDSAVQAKLGVLNGQVTYNGKPLYTFVSDSPGQASGNGQMDNFNGTSFTWTAATTSGSAGSSAASGSAATPTTSSNTSSGGSSGGYGY